MTAMFYKQAAPLLNILILFTGIMLLKLDNY